VRQHDDPNRAVLLRRAEPVRQLAHQLLGQGIAVGRGIQGDRGDAAGHGVADQLT
jgi:hypothetical protein